MAPPSPEAQRPSFGECRGHAGQAASLFHRGRSEAHRAQAMRAAPLTLCCLRTCCCPSCSVSVDVATGATDVGVVDLIILAVKALALPKARAPATTCLVPFKRSMRMQAVRHGCHCTAGCARHAALVRCAHEGYHVAEQRGCLLVPLPTDP
eukprot:scaffold1036_cov343-Prasinococcus_capsulatus_cf.AAC.1